MREGLNTKWLIGMIVGLIGLSAMAEMYPEPQPGKKYAARDLAGRTGDLEGKVVRIIFNRIAEVRKLNEGLYGGELRSQSKPKLSDEGTNTFSDDPGVVVQFPVEGFGFLSKFIPEVGCGMYDYACLSRENSGTAFVLIGDSVSIALGDRYKDGEYEWSTKTKIPDLADAKKISVTELFLFPEQVKGKIIPLEFYYADKLRTGSPGSTVCVSSGYLGGHLPVLVEFPTEGLEFFEEAVSQDKVNIKAHTVFVTVDVSSANEISVKALGRRQRGKGDDATYKW